jgi:2-oxoglutarate ferredoxin oxidoreductase subunit alpha
VSYDPANHDRMVHLRAEKIARVVQDVPDLTVMGEESGDLLVLGWGSTYGVITTAVQRAQADGKKVAAAHIRHVNPLPANVGDVLRRYDRVLMPEVNLGQMRMLLRSRFLMDIIGLNKVSGRPFTISEVEEKIHEIVG